MSLSHEAAKKILTDILAKAHKRFKQEMDGENEEFLDRTIRLHRAKVARFSWKLSQKWCKWDDEGPVLMPDYTRIYYKKGITEILLQEFPPQIRLMKFRGNLAKGRSSGDALLSEEERRKVYSYSLPLPYTVFLFKFVDGMFSEVKCAFSDRPLKRLEERPLRPYLSNIDSNLNICLGSDLDRSQLVRHNLTQQSSFILSHFWQSVYTDEWGLHYWNTKAHFASDPRLATLSGWQEAGYDNPLFVVEDVDWLKHSVESFGDMIVSVLEKDKQNVQFNEDLYNEFIDEFLTDVKKTFKENIDSIEKKAVSATVDSLATELVERINAL